MLPILCTCGSWSIVCDAFLRQWGAHICQSEHAPGDAAGRKSSAGGSDWSKETAEWITRRKNQTKWKEKLRILNL